jgi:hypothetical protein
MKFRRLLFLAIGLKLSLVGITAHGSYVVEAEGVGINSAAMATGADFDFVAHDFGMESKDAIQITLDNLSSATNLQGNLLLGSFTSDSSEDYSYYDNDVVDADQNSNGLIANVANGEDYTTFAASSAPLPAGIQNFPSIDTNAIFWMLGPTRFTSFSQLTAARFGFYHSQ